MYQPRHYLQDDPPTLHALIRRHPLAMLVRQSADGLTADHLPLEIDPSVGPHGVLRGHVARANPIWREADGQPVMAVFRGVDAYISPNWYPSKAEHHKAVPTWNYAVVHGHGPLHAVQDRDWLRGLVGRLTAVHESGRVHPWSLADAPEDFVQQMLEAIVGIEIPLTRLVGKFKLTQNRSAADRQGVADGLLADGQAAMAEMIRPAAPEPTSPAG
jgi:transcriptional regulator